MSKNDLKKEVDDLIARQRGFQTEEKSPCQNCIHPKDCKIPIFLGTSHDKIIGWKTCSHYSTQKR
jgi:hypothetical protein